MTHLMFRAISISLFCLGLLACERQPTAPAAPATTAAPAAMAKTGAAGQPLADVSESTPDYMIGISYPPSAARYPGLAIELKRYAEAARAELMQAVEGRQALGEATSPYDLSISFTDVLDSPTLVAVAADGSSYTGGAHGTPLLARFVWLPQTGRLLTAVDLVPGAKGWEAIANNVREQLHTALSQRADADSLPAGERIELVKSAGRMIQEGTEPSPANFAIYEPVVAPSGKLRALRFVFAPYQVGPYSDGVQTAEVPAAVLLPHIAPAYRDLFETGPG